MTAEQPVCLKIQDNGARPGNQIFYFYIKDIWDLVAAALLMNPKLPFILRSLVWHYSDMQNVSISEHVSQQV